MLSDGEQRRLAEIETLLRLDDPSFARRFDARLRANRRRRLLPLAAMITVAVIVAALAVVGGVLAVIGS
jgi:hypothetical protein